jgi:hypothetical protein
MAVYTHIIAARRSRRKVWPSRRAIAVRSTLVARQHREVTRPRKGVGRRWQHRIFFRARHWHRIMAPTPSRHFRASFSYLKPEPTHDDTRCLATDRSLQAPGRVRTSVCDACMQIRDIHTCSSFHLEAAARSMKPRVSHRASEGLTYDD